MRKITKSVALWLCGICASVCVLAGGGALLFPWASAEEAGESAVTYKKSDIFEYDDYIELVEDERPFETSANDGINAEPNASTAVGKSTNGVGIYASSSGATFTYKNEIDFSDLTVEDNLIELFPLYADKWAAISTIRVTFTDTENEDNTFSVYYYTFTNGALYARVEYAGKSLALGNESSNMGKLMEQYGTWCSGNYLTLTPSKTYPTPISVCVDYAERQVFIRRNDKVSLVLDLDDVTQVGKGAVWQGFEKNTAYMSVSIGFAQSKRGGVIVKSVMGHNLDGSFYKTENGESVLNKELFDAPAIQFDMPESYSAKMPNAAVGVAYPLPKAIARDWFFGTCADSDVTVGVFKKDALGQYSEDVSSLISGGNFIPAKAGDYQLVYTANNPVKSEQKRLSFQVVENLPAISIQMTEEFVQPEILTQLYIPALSVYGGSGELTLTETLYYNGVEQELTDSRALYIDKPGTVLLKAVCEGYCGDVAVEYFSLVIPDAVVLSVQNMPKILQSSTTVTLPEAICYDTRTGLEKTVEISVDGVSLGADRTYSVEKTSGTVEVKYSADGASEKTFVIPVVNGTTMRPADLMLIKSGNVTAENSSSGVRLISAESGSESYWAYPVVTGYATNRAAITIANCTKTEGGVKTGMANFDYVDITFANFESETETAFIRIYRDCDADANMSYVQINGVGTKYLVDGNLGVEDSVIYLCVDTANGYLQNGVNYSPICEFGGYSAQVSIIGFKFGNVTQGETAGIVVSMLSNQALRSFDGWSDINKPVVSFASELKKSFEAKLGSTVKLPEAKAYDMLSENAAVRVIVYGPDSKTVALAEDGSFIVDKTGEYRITYVAEDINGKKGNVSYYCTVYEDKEPVLTIEQALPSTAALGSSIRVPNATATDENDGECTVYVFMRYQADYSFEALSFGDTYTFTKKGVYKLTYLTRDANFNYVEYAMTITVG